jgi:hypothetical protein
MIEWRICPRCSVDCQIVPISPMFDKTGERYGFQFVCLKCKFIDPNQFISYEQMKYLIEDSEGIQNSKNIDNNNNKENSIVHRHCTDRVRTVQSSIGGVFFGER